MHVRRRMTTNITMKQLTWVTSIHFSYAPSHKMREKEKKRKDNMCPLQFALRPKRQQNNNIKSHKEQRKDLSLIHI